MEVTLSQHPNALRACTAQSWDDLETGTVGKAGGDGERASSCWACLPWLQVSWDDLRGWASPAAHPSCQGRWSRAGHMACATSATCFWH